MTFVKGDPRAGRPKGVQNKSTQEVKDFARSFLESEAYRESVKDRILNGSAPHMETLLHHYAYGKPVERIEHSGTLSLEQLVEGANRLEKVPAVN